MSVSTDQKLVLSGAEIRASYLKILGCYPGFSYDIDELFIEILYGISDEPGYDYAEHLLSRTLQRASIETADPFDVPYMRGALKEFYQTVLQAVDIRRSYDPPGVQRPWFYYGTLGTDFVIGTDDLSLTDIPGD